MGYRIRFNPLKSQLLTIGGDNPPGCQLLLDNKPVQWCVRVKYLGIYLLAGKTVKIDLTVTKGKYYGCYNSITSVCGKQRNETVTLHLVKTYCLPRLLYACEVLSFSNVQTHELDVIWNNAFRRIFNCFWRESVKPLPLQYFCSSLPLSWLMDERRLVFYRKTMVHSNIVIKTLMSVSGVYFDYIGLCHKYQIPNPYCSVSYIKHERFIRQSETADNTAQ